MFESLKFVSKRERMRNRIAKEIKSSRRDEEKGFMETDRSGHEYVEKLEGVEEIFNYVRTLPSKTILDLGAGTTRAIRELAQSEMGQGLTFEATVLRNNPAIQNEDNLLKIHVTSVEVLRGIPDNSIGGVIAFYSIAYSEEPELAIRRLDKVLVPGGVVKATFYHYPPGRSSIIRIVPSLSNQFHYFWKKKGYDVKILMREQREVLVAVKPGGSVSAEELIRKDQREYRDQLSKLAK